MPIMVKDNGADFERLEPGTYTAVCSHVLDLGTQPSMFGDKDQVALCFEVNEKMSDGRPFMVSEIYTASLNKKAKLRQHIDMWRGKPLTEQESQGFDIEKLRFVMANITVIEKEGKDNKTWLHIAAITKCPAGTESIKPVNTTAPEWLLNKQKEGLERRSENAAWATEVVQNAPSDNGNEESLPF